MDDIEAIKQLKARYCRMLDTKDWDGFRQVLADDVVMDSTGSGGSVITGIFAGISGTGYFTYCFISSRTARYLGDAQPASVMGAS